MIQTLRGRLWILWPAHISFGASFGCIGIGTSKSAENIFFFVQWIYFDSISFFVYSTVCDTHTAPGCCYHFSSWLSKICRQPWEVMSECRRHFFWKVTNFSLTLLTVSPADMRTMNVVARWPWSVHDPTIFVDSNVHERFETGESSRYISVDCYDYANTSYLANSHVTNRET